MGLPEVWSMFLNALYSLVMNAYDVFFQTWGMRHLPKHIDDIGGPVEGLTAIVTGPTSGIGLETAAALVRRGATVVLACRDLQRGGRLRDDLLAAAKAAGRKQPNVEVRELDLCSLVSVRLFAAAFEAEGRPLHILVNNAGVFTIGAGRAETRDGFELHLGSNHLAHFLLTLSLMPALRRGAAAATAFGARVVTVSSSYHALAAGLALANPHLVPGKGGPGYSAEAAYAQSKLANVLFTRELRRRLRSDPRLFACSLHPGMVLSGVVRSLPPWVQAAYRAIMGLILLTPMQGARASIYAATSPSAPAECEPTCGYFNSNCKPVMPAPAACDDAAALWLWRWSAQQVGLPQQLDLPE